MSKQGFEESPMGPAPVFDIKDPKAGEKIENWVEKKELSPEYNHENRLENWRRKAARKRFKKVGERLFRVDTFWVYFHEPLTKSAYVLLEKVGDAVEARGVPFTQASWLVATGLLSKSRYKDHLKQVERQAKERRQTLEEAEKYASAAPNGGAQ